MIKTSRRRAAKRTAMLLAAVAVTMFLLTVLAHL